MRKLILIILVSLIILVQAVFDDVNAKWTITTNGSGARLYSCVLTAVTTSSDVAYTNYKLSAGFIKGKRTPEWYFTTVITQINSAALVNGSSSIPLIHLINATNIIFGRTIEPSPAAYMKFKIFILRPNPTMR